MTSAQSAPTGAPSASPVTLGATVPDGCFAWSPSRREVVCVVGAFSRVTTASRTLAVGHLDGAPSEQEAFEVEGGGALEGAAASAIRAHVRADHRAMPAPSLDLTPAGTGGIGALTLSLAHRERTPAGDNAAPRADVTLDVRAGARSVLHDALDDVACATPRVRAWPLGDAILVERTCAIADEGQQDLDVAAWLCRAATCSALQ